MSMTRRGTLLLDRSSEEIDSLLLHPRQVENARQTAALISELRACRQAEHYFEFQRKLFNVVYACQVYGSRITRARKRHTARKAFDTDLLGASGDLRTEELVNDRLVRQLRSVGDALAWKLFHYDRRYILALSQNQQPGPMAGKLGLKSELQLVEKLWLEGHRLGLLHDLTTCLRIGDVSEFRAEGEWATLHEVKLNPRRRDPHQARRASAAIATIQGTDAMGGSGERTAILRSPCRLKTVLPAARNVIEEAANIGFASRRLPGPRVLTVMDGTSRGLRNSSEAALSSILAVRDQALSDAGVNGGSHRLRAHTADKVTRLPAFAPLAVFPYKPTVCARLICDYTVMEWFIGESAFRDALESAGLHVRISLPLSDGTLEPADAILQAFLRDRAVTIHSTAVHQFLLEGLDISMYATALREVLERRGDAISGVLTFSGEQSVWR